MVDQIKALESLTSFEICKTASEQTSEIGRATGTEGNQQMSSKSLAIPGAERRGRSAKPCEGSNRKISNQSGIGTGSHNKVLTGRNVKMAEPIRKMATPTGFEPVLPA